MAVPKIINRVYIDINKGLYSDVGNIKSFPEVFSDISRPAIKAATLKLHSEYLVKIVIEHIIITFKIERQITLPIEDVQKFIDPARS